MMIIDLSESWVPTLINLGHSYRKVKNYKSALHYYRMAQSLAVPRDPQLYSSIGFTLQLMGEVDKAIDCYHQALGLKSDDTFANVMLSRALST